MKLELKSGIRDRMCDQFHAAPFQPFVVVLHLGERLRVNESRGAKKLIANAKETNAAWTAVTRIVMNTDEFITRN